MTRFSVNSCDLCAGGRWQAVLTLVLVSSLALVPLACLSSTADSSGDEEEQQVDETETATAESTSYDIPEYTDERSVQQRLNDETVATQVKRALQDQSSLRLFDFEPMVEGRTITLRGDVNTRAQWEQVGEVAARIVSDREVVNDVTIGGLPADTVAESDGSEESPEAAAVYHTVQRGESLWLIARQYGASVQRIQSLNQLGNQSLQAGERIRVR